MKKPIFLSILFSITLTFSAIGKTDNRPNIVFVFIDDLGWNGISCQGNKYVNTPNIDKLAAGGVRFTDAYAMPQCSPSRFAFLTGQYGARTNAHAVVHENHVLPYAKLKHPAALRVLPPEAFNIAKMFKQAGYHAGMIGKWHVDVGEKKNKAAMGWDAYIRQYGFDPMKPKESIPNDPKNVMNMTNATLHYLESNQDKPVFAYLAHNTVHTGLTAPDRFLQKYIDKGYAKSPDPWGSLENGQIADYLAMIDYLDHSIGVLMDGIEDLDLERETAVIFMSDNGGLSRVWDMKPLRRGKGSEYEGGVRVPLIMHWEGKWSAGRISEEPVHLIDLFPTFMEMAEGSVKDDYILDGQSLLPIASGKGKLNREAIYMNNPTYIPHYHKTPSCFIRMGDYKLIKFYGDYHRESDRKLILEKKVELYNLRTDRSELNDLYGELPEKAAEMEKMLDTWLKDTGAQVPVLNPDFDKEKYLLETSDKVDVNGDPINYDKMKIWDF